MYFAIKDIMKIKLKGIGVNRDNTFETMNEVKIIKTKINGRVRVFILLFSEVEDSKSLIMAHGGIYKENELLITDSIDNTLYSLDGTIRIVNTEGNEEIKKVIANRCRFIEFPLLNECLDVECCEITQFVSCIEVFKDKNGVFLKFSK